ncbi:MAG: ATP-dependent helicase C-terminal domain-containing protein [Thioalkalivibrionaceae bacterium]
MTAEFAIDAYRTKVLAALHPGASVVLSATPGAGKTTRVPLWLIEGSAESSLQSSFVPARSGPAQICRWWLTVPRRMAARAAAERLASSLGEPVGQRIALHTRDEHQESPQSRIIVMTEGVALRRLVSDPALEGVAGVALDEFHERSATIDLLLALLRHARGLWREDLRVLLMSASVELDDLSQQWDASGAQRALVAESALTSIDIPGRVYPLRVSHVGAHFGGQNAGAASDRLLLDRRGLERVVDIVTTALAGQLSDDRGQSVTLDHDGAVGGGDVLIFLPGVQEIRRLAELLRPRLPTRDVVIELHGGTSPRHQRAALCRGAGLLGRRWILATDVAETSVTIEGVRNVIDCGLHRRPRFDANVGLTRLETRWITKANAVQRAGRAGRTAPGNVLRLYPEARFAAWPRALRPSLLDSDLAETILAIAAYGATSEELAWLVVPPAGACEQASDLLRRFDALDDDARITPQGRRLWQSGTSPRLARLLLSMVDQTAAAAAFERDRALTTAAHLAALLEAAPSPTAAVDLRESLDALLRVSLDRQSNRRAGRGFAVDGLAPQTLANIIARATRLRDRAAMSAARGVASGAMAPEATSDSSRERASSDRRDHTVRDDTRRSMHDGWSVRTDPALINELSHALMRAFPDRIARLEDGRLRLVNGRWARVGAYGSVGESHRAVLRDAAGAVAVEVNAGAHAGDDVLARRVWPLAERAWSNAPGRRESRGLIWHADAGRVEAWREQRIGALVLERCRVPLERDDAPAASAALVEGLCAEWRTLEHFDDPPRGSSAAAALAARIEFLHRVFSAPDTDSAGVTDGLVWPSVTPAVVLSSVEQWLVPLVAGLSRRDEIAALDPLGAWPVGAWLMAQDPRLLRALAQLAPTHWVLPSGRRAAIEYRPLADPPAAYVAARVQEWFGLSVTPRIAAGRVPLTIELCSPAGRPAAVTQDLAGFWARGYAAVRRDLRGRYPRHPWPDDPLTASATQRAKPRGE